MKEFSFIHTSDIHLDSPFKGISEIDEKISVKLTEATFRSFNRIIDLCIERQVDFLLVAGDIYNEMDRSLRAQIRFRDGMKKLSDTGIKAYIVHGNHDPLDGWAADLDWPDNVYIFGGESVEKVSVEKDGEEIALIYGISFNTREVTTNLASRFPVKKRTQNGIFTIGLLHCNVGNTGHQAYAPCTLDDLLGKKFDYWALGHVHNKTILNKENPPVIYPGNPQGLNPKESGSRGCFLVNVDRNGKPRYEFKAVDSVRWSTENLSISSFATEEELISGIYDYISNIRQKTENCSCVIRIILTGRGPLHSTVIRKGFLDDILKEIRENEKVENQFVWIESIKDNTHPEIDRDSLMRRRDFIGDLVRVYSEFLKGEDEKEELRKYLEPLFTSADGIKLLSSIETKDFLELIKKAETLSLDRILSAENTGIQI